MMNPERTHTLSPLDPYNQATLQARICSIHACIILIGYNLRKKRYFSIDMTILKDTILNDLNQGKI